MENMSNMDNVNQRLISIANESVGKEITLYTLQEDNSLKSFETLDQYNVYVQNQYIFTNNMIKDLLTEAQEIWQEFQPEIQNYISSRVRKNEKNSSIPSPVQMQEEAFNEVWNQTSKQDTELKQKSVEIDNQTFHNIPELHLSFWQQANKDSGSKHISKEVPRKLRERAINDIKSKPKQQTYNKAAEQDAKSKFEEYERNLSRLTLRCRL
jgi:hypothetical protein